MGKFKAGDEVRILNTWGIGGAFTEGYKDNEVVTLVGHNGMLAFPGKVTPTPLVIAASEFKYIELVDSKPFKNHRIEALEKRVGELELIVHELRGRKVVEPSTDKVVEDKPFIPEPVKTPNRLRAEIIEKAKGFVEEKKNSYGEYEVDDNNDPFGFPFLCNVDFVVNKEKRTIAALMRGMHTKNIYAKGIAKCNPSDVFNEHIGKAIALGRALGLDVSEFEGAVQPTVAIGQVIEVLDTEGKTLNLIRTVEVINRLGYPSYNRGTYASDYKIINDTNAIYGEVE